MEALLYHGTTESRASSIRQNGFAPAPVSDQLKHLAAQHQVNYETLIALMTQAGRFATSQGRDQCVWFTGQHERASSYAQRAPEFVWEGLVCIYRLRHSLGDDWNQSDPLHWWVLRHRLDDSPVVITASIPEGQLPCRAEDAKYQIDLALTPPMPPSIVTSVERVPWRLDSSLIRFIAGFGVEQNHQFADEVEAGKWGEPVGRDPLLGSYWDWDDFRTRLSDARIEELWEVD
jgi:hypothetical protein